MNLEIKKPKLLDQVRNDLRVNHYSRKTAETYISWIKRYILFHNKRHPKEMGKEEIQNFVNYFAIEKHVASSTQNQALQAILFLYKKIVKKDVEWLDDIRGVKRIKHLHVVFSKKETTKIFEHLSGVTKLIVSLLYGEGLRLNEALNLRIKDIDFDYQQIVVRDEKGEKDRHTILPTSIIPELKKHLNEVYKQHKADLLKTKEKQFCLTH